MHRGEVMAATICTRCARGIVGRFKALADAVGWHRQFRGGGRQVRSGFGFLGIVSEVEDEQVIEGNQVEFTRSLPRLSRTEVLRRAVRRSPGGPQPG